MSSAPSSSASINGRNGHVKPTPSQTGSETYEVNPAYPENGFPPYVNFSGLGLSSRPSIWLSDRILQHSI